jgi:hypothetical protein
LGKAKSACYFVCLAVGLVFFSLPPHVYLSPDAFVSMTTFLENRHIKIFGELLYRN